MEDIINIPNHFSTWVSFRGHSIMFVIRVACDKALICDGLCFTYHVAIFVNDFKTNSLFDIISPNKKG